MRGKIILFFILSVILLSSCTGENKWEMAADIENAILRTSFPADTFNIIDFGAVQGDTNHISVPQRSHRQ